MYISYTLSLLVFAILNIVLFIFSYISSGKTKVITFIVLMLEIALFFYMLLMYDWIFIKIHELFVLTVFTLSVLLVTLTYFITRRKLLWRYSIVVVIGITWLASLLEYMPNIMNGFIEISEETPDAVAYIVFNHWSFSLKNPFYDIINVASFWIAIIHLVPGVDNIMYDPPNIALYFTIALLITLSAYITYKKFGAIHAIPIAVALALATPYITFTTIPPSLSAMYAVLTIMLITREEMRLTDYIVILLLSTAGVLTHATAIGMLLFGTSALYLASRLFKANNSKIYLNILALISVIYLIISIVRFIYAGKAYLSIIPYYADFLRLLNFLQESSTVQLRVTRYGEYAPFITSFSWSVYPALAASYIVLLLILRRRLKRNEAFSFSLLSAGLLLIFAGFVLSRFSNSFSRESGYPGYMLLFLGSFEPLRHIIEKENKMIKVILFTILYLAIFSGMFTIKDAPWIYIGKVPYLSYKPPSPSDILKSENLLKLAGVDISRLIIYQNFAPDIYTVELIKWKLIDLNRVSAFNIHITTAYINSTSNIIFNSQEITARLIK